ncbi:DUF3987 domain-containing protein [Ectothiorhodospiraceae bacterium BW-2]|nr:DUF3987 domain-containing protein [Ectothiorhodospiraceae bacterium BW-2]
MDNSAIRSAEKGAHWLDELSGIPDEQPPIPAEITQIKQQQAHEWPAPGEIGGRWDRGEFPIDALPETIKQAVLDHQKDNRQPLPLIVSSALATVSLAVQGLTDVGRDREKGLSGPVSLFFLTIAESGERKSRADSAFNEAVKNWEKAEIKNRIDDHKRQKSAHEVWQAKTAGIKSDIKKLAGKAATADADAAQKIEDMQQELAALDVSEPKIDPLPDLFYSEGTAEAIAAHLGEGWPSASVCTAEGGTLIGSRAMSAESAIVFMAMLNVFWDGGSWKPRRKTVSAPPVSGIRLTASIMVQRLIMDKLLEAGSREIGLLARALITEPVSTMGTRFIKDRPPLAPGDLGFSRSGVLSQFESRIENILKQPLNTNEAGELNLPITWLSHEAWQVWRKYHNDIERELAPMGELALLKDAASKSADNAARIAACLQVFETGNYGNDTEISADYMERGCVIARWYLNEALVFFGKGFEPEDERNAKLLSQWLVNEAPNKSRDGEPIMVDRKMTLRNILWVGPHSLRNTKTRDAALATLADSEVSHLRLFKIGKQKWLELNPQLFENKSVYKHDSKSRNESQQLRDSWGK